MDSIFSDRISDVPRSFIREILKVTENPEVISFAGGLPSPEVLQKQPRWTYFMCWSEFIQEHNPVELVNAEISGGAMFLPCTSTQASPFSAEAIL